MKVLKIYLFLIYIRHYVIRVSVAFVDQYIICISQIKLKCKTQQGSSCVCIICTPKMKYLGVEVVNYRYFDEETRGVDFDGMIADLKTATKDDVILLHGCCHNPTGANLNATQWDAVIEVLLATGATPMVDIAYQGFGDGLDADAAATRKVVASVHECLIAASCSKNFGNGFNLCT